MPIHSGEPIQDAQVVIAVDESLNFDGQHSFGDVISNGQNFQYPPVSGVIKLETRRPHMIRELHSEPLSGYGHCSHEGTFTRGNPYAYALIAE